MLYNRVMEKRYQVFISSTYSDLQEERGKVMQAVMSMDCIPSGMELFPAIDEEQFNFIKRVIDDCDYYIIIIGGRYGSITDDGISYTEKEYDYAVSQKVPVIALIHKNIGKIPREKTDTEPALIKKLDSFCEKVKTGKIVKFWQNTDELTGLVALSLMHTIKTYPRTGWVKANLSTSAETLHEINELRKQLADLEAYKNAIERDKLIANNKLVKKLAGLDTQIEIKGISKYRSWIDGEPNIEHPWTIKKSFEELFSIIAPKIMYPSVKESQVKTYLMNRLYELATEDFIHDRKEFFTPRLNNSYIDTIKIQFIALGLLEVYIDKTEKGHTLSCWRLTDKGYNTMMQILSVKK